MNEAMNETISQGFMSLTNAITPVNVLPGTDATGGHVESLTEAIMGITKALVMISASIDDLTEVVRESKQ